METQLSDLPIVVGIDGSEQSQQAMIWALDEAARVKAPVHLVHVMEWLPGFREVVSEAANRRVLERAQQTADAALTEAQALRPEVATAARIETGVQTTVLCDISKDARMLVLGSRGRGGFVGLLTGSVCETVAAHAHCPVVMVRVNPTAARLPVVVGVDPSASGRLAVRFAFEQAASRDVALIGVRAWHAPMFALDRPHALDGEELDRFESVERELLNRLLSEVSVAFPDVPVERRLVASPAAAAVLAQAEHAQLVVVGSRGHGGFAGALLGSVSRQVLHHARCPVAIVREVHAAGRSPYEVRR
jgi:nucleotide-binding universal stress UspA family protein